MLTTRADVEVARTTVKSNADVGGAVASAATPIGIGAGAVIASDNTLGLFSPHQGRLYVAFVDRDPTTAQPGRQHRHLGQGLRRRRPDLDRPGQPVPPTRRTTPNNASGDDRRSVRVNDDNGLPSTATPTPGSTATPASARRPAAVPARASPSTTPPARWSSPGTTPAHDAAGPAWPPTWPPRSTAARASPARARQPGYADLGHVPAFANDPLIATDLATGLPVVLGPIPDNQSVNGNREATFGFGDRQAL